MEKTKLIDLIIEKEWKMFHNVNGEERASCQNDRLAFEGMRGAQYSEWSAEALESYYSDIEHAEEQGRNLAREKYIRMMESTDPKAYESFSAELPEASPEKAELVSKIWNIMLRQTERMREKYPMIALGGRPLHKNEECSSWASIETYQTCELMTYSEATLRAFLKHITELEADGIDFAYRVQENTIHFAGYPTMQDAERMMMERTMQELGAEIDTSGCCCGGC